MGQLWTMWPWPLTSPVILTLDFQCQILKQPYVRNAKTDWHDTIGCWTLCDFELWSRPSIFRVKGVGRLIGMEWKGCGSMGCWAHYVVLNFDLTYDLSLGFSMSNFEIAVYVRSRKAYWHGTKGTWVDRMLDTLCDLELWLHPWPWPGIFKGEFRNCRISEVGGSIDMEQKGCGSTGCWPLCDLKLPPHTWPRPWIFKVKFWNSRIWGGGPSNMKRKGFESIGFCPHFATLPHPWPWQWISGLKFKF